MLNDQEYKTDKYLTKVRIRIDDHLDKIGNKVEVFDFGHYFARGNNRYLFKPLVFGSKSYCDVLFPKRIISKEKNEYTYFNGNLKQIINIPAPSSKKQSQYDIEDELFNPDPEIIETDWIFPIYKWIETLEDKNIEGCLLVYARKVGNYQSVVWLVLKNRIEEFVSKDENENPVDQLICFGFKEECINCSDDVKKVRVCLFENINYFNTKKKNKLKARINDVFYELDNLLINELVFNAEKYTKQIEKEKLAEKTQRIVLKKFQDEVLEVHAHTIKNCFPDIKSMKSKIESLIPQSEYKKIKDIIEEENIVNDELVHIIKRVTQTNDEKSYRVIEILDFLRKHVKPSEANFVPIIFEGEKDIIDHLRLNEKQEDNAFTLFWNLWRNCKTASINSKIQFNVLLKNNVNNELEISFINEASSDEHIKNVLDIINSSTLPIKEPKGLNIVRHKASELGWNIIAQNIEKKLIIIVTTKS